MLPIQPRPSKFRPFLCIKSFFSVLNLLLERFDTISCHILIVGFCRKGLLEAANSLWESMVHVGVPCRDDFSYHILIDGYSKVGQMTEALDLLEWMQKEGISPNSVSYNSLIRGLCKVGDFTAAQYLLVETLGPGKVDPISGQPAIGSSDLHPSLITYTTFISGYCQPTQRHAAFLLYGELVQRDFLPDVVPYTSLMAGLCTSGQVAEALKLFAEMTTKGGVVVRGNVFDLVTYPAWMDGFFKAGQVGEAEDVFKTISPLPLVPTHITSSALIEGRSTAGDLRGAEYALDDMQRIRVNLHVVSSTSIVNGYIRTGMFVGGLDVVKQMVAQHISPHVVTTGSLIPGYLHEGTIDVAFDVYVAMTQRQHIEPHHYVRAFLVNGLSNTGWMEDAESFFRDMQQRGLSPDCVHCPSLLDGLFTLGATSTAFQVGKEMLDRNFVAGVAYNVFLHCVCNSGKLSAVEDVYFALTGRGFDPAPVTSSILINAHLREGLLDTFFEWHNEMTTHGLSLDLIPSTHLIGGLCEAGEWQQAAAVLHEMDRLAALLQMLPVVGSVTSPCFVLHDTDAAWPHGEQLALAYGLIRTPQNSTLAYGWTRPRARAPCPIRA